MRKLKKANGMFDHSKIFRGGEILDIIGGLKKDQIKPIKTLGEHAYVAEGYKKTIIVWYCGTDWYQIIMEW